VRRDAPPRPGAAPEPGAHVAVDLIGTVEGVCEGLIATAPRGHNGFGYDPIFLLPERGRTMAELTVEEKQAISHRGRAGVAARRLLHDWLLETAPARP
jgi:non-canonical purine NTP pyrophosphatase (RdgB/HAM1 family)